MMRRALAPSAIEKVDVIVLLTGEIVKVYEVK
jgi:hypothetical protein